MPEGRGLNLLIDLHKRSQRQGPGGEVEIDLALALANLRQAGCRRLLDIGCGTGAAALHLARRLDAEITAVDLAPEFISILNDNAGAQGVSEKLQAVVASMAALPFADGEFDLLWSEAAIYNIGFEHGVAAWRQLLDADGTLVVSDITWTTPARPEPLQQYWESQYSEIDTPSEKIAVLARCGYLPVGYFLLPEHCWLDNYYQPLQHNFAVFLQEHAGDPEALAIVEAEEEEIQLYNRYKSYFGYGVYIARKI